MLEESLDPHLESAIASLCDGDWSTARDALSQRLDETARLGKRRLNLFLLSVAAQRSGLPEVGAQFAELARVTPPEMGEPRYLGNTADPVRRQLEEVWWRFNNWNPEQLPGSHAAETSSELDWPSILDNALEGRAGELERRLSRHLDGNHPQRRILWNLVAVGYLESGDPRTYEEMRSEAPAGSIEVPDELAFLLEQAGLYSALEDLRAGRWLTTDCLTSSEVGPVDGKLAQAAEAWESEMEASFSLLSVGRGTEAARKLGPLTMLQGLSPLHRAYTLNALALALLASGEYGGAEEALRDGRVEAEECDPSGDPEMAERYAMWLQSCGFRPSPDSPFCDPFAASPSLGQDEAGSPEADERFWNSFQEVLVVLRDGDLSSARRVLRGLSSGETTRAFLIALLFAGAALLEGDHMEAQELIDDASRLLELGGLDEEALLEARGRLQATGAVILAGKMDARNLSTLDPWRDFPADFPQQSLSG